MNSLLVRAYFACAVVVDAARIKEASKSSVDVESDHTWIRSCDFLQARFVKSNEQLQILLDTTDSGDSSVGASVRVVMKASAILRTLRRSQQCPWVLDGTAGNSAALGNAVNTLLANNPCAHAAMTELKQMEDDNSGTAPLGRAMSILLSDDCEVKPVEDFNLDTVNDVVNPTNFEAEELLMEGVEDIMMTESEGTSDSLLEKSESSDSGTRTLRTMAKVLGAVMVGVFFALQCANTAFWIAGFIGVAFTLLFTWGLENYGSRLRTINELWFRYGKSMFWDLRDWMGLAYMPAFLFASVAFLGGASKCSSAYTSLLNSTNVSFVDAH